MSIQQLLQTLPLSFQTIHTSLSAQAPSNSNPLQQPMGTININAPSGTNEINHDIQEQLYVDIGANLLDDMYKGIYRGKNRHENDLDQVLERAWENNLDKIIITAGTLSEAKEALNLSKQDDRLYFTAGVHPTRCSSEFGDSDESLDEYMLNLGQVIEEGMSLGKIVAIGELGLDYARLQFSNVEDQKKGFEKQLQLAKTYDLPLFIHNRDTGTDCLDVLRDCYFDDAEAKRAGGVVHSFDDSIELAQKFLELGLYIGINGCSLKTDENLKVVKSLPLDRLLIETDCPWCDIRITHAGSDYVATKFETKTEKKYENGKCVKGRYEPCHIKQVCEVIAGVKGISVQDVATTTRNNAYALFRRLSR